MGFALDDDDASCSAGTNSKEVELEPPSTKVGVLLPLSPFDNKDALDGAPLAAPLKDGRALEGFIIIGSGEIIFFLLHRAATKIMQYWRSMPETKKNKLEIKIELNFRRAQSTIFRGFLAVRIRLNHVKAKILNNLAYLEWVGLISAKKKRCKCPQKLGAGPHLRWTSLYNARAGVGTGI